MPSRTRRPEARRCRADRRPAGGAVAWRAIVAATLACVSLPGTADAQASAAPGFHRVGGEPADLRGPVRAPDADPVVDRSVDHVVARGDTLGSIGARYGVSARFIASDNQLDPRKPLRPGQVLRVTSRHVVPPSLEDGVVINVPQRMLFHFRAGRVVRAFPVAVGRPDWPTPTGEFRIVSRQTDKTWIVPVSIQDEMRREGKPVLTEVPPGPDNPLGRHWIGLSLPAIGIHGTIAPSSVYGFRSHGCVRVHPDDVAGLFEQVRVGERGRIVYLPVLLSQGGDGRIWFEANPDAYRRGSAGLDTVRAMASDRGIAPDALDWELIANMLRARDGLAREVGIDRDRGAERMTGGG